MHIYNFLRFKNLNIIIANPSLIIAKNEIYMYIYNAVLHLFITFYYDVDYFYKKKHSYENNCIIYNIIFIFEYKRSSNFFILQDIFLLRSIL